MAKVDKLNEMLRPSVEALGFEFVGVEYVGQGKHSVLRIYIDHENGINVDDCASVSHQVSGILEVEDPITSQYSLEVSSPGMERPLFTLEHFSAYVGKLVNIKCHVGVDGRRKFKGELVAIKDEMLTVVVDGQDFNIDFQDIDKANLVAEF
jgi:ribosome maturation factor RimP